MVVQPLHGIGGTIRRSLLWWKPMVASVRSRM